MSQQQMPPAPPGGYGVPPGAPAAPTAPGGRAFGQGKPNWRNLSTGGGSKTPVKEFTGKFVGWEFVNLYQREHASLRFAQCTIIASDSPYPYTEVELIIPNSDRDNSAWGHFGKSVATATGIGIDDLDVDSIIGMEFHMERIDNWQYGIDKEGKPIAGIVWRAKGSKSQAQVMAEAQQAQPAAPLVQNPNL